MQRLGAKLRARAICSNGGECVEPFEEGSEWCKLGAIEAAGFQDERLREKLAEDEIGDARRARADDPLTGPAADALALEHGRPPRKRERKLVRDERGAAQLIPLRGGHALLLAYSVHVRLDVGRVRHIAARDLIK